MFRIQFGAEDQDHKVVDCSRLMELSTSRPGGLYRGFLFWPYAHLGVYRLMLRSFETVLKPLQNRSDCIIMKGPQGTWDMLKGLGCPPDCSCKSLCFLGLPPGACSDRMAISGIKTTSERFLHMLKISRPIFVFVSV